MPDMIRPLALFLSLGLLATPALAQDSTTPPPADAPEATTEAPAAPATPATEGVVGTDAATTTDDGLALGTEVTDDGVGSTYTQEVFTDWEMRCVRTAEGNDPCQLYQLLKDPQGNPVAEFSMFPLPPGQQAAAGATIVTPLETLLTQQITLTVDAGAAKRYPFTWCSPVGCIARVGFTPAEIDGFKRGSKATLTIVPVAAPDSKVDLDISLKGFTAGFDAVAALASAAAE